ncbi:lasso peptide biosynthesis B2 protein [Deinococcus oregonensis]|uniref:Lasso peptide biosynthesis B2 protein n=1 Tax=Deinococcus oregonensis TaxID=1805970 RepID=A0ABV6B393_9DEIO
MPVDSDVLVRALTTDPPQISAEDVPHIVAAGLAGEVRGRLPPDHPFTKLLWPGHLALGVRHSLIRSELRPLIAAWEREGIPALLFKGFALTEFEYATPGERFYGDVDVLLPEEPATVIRAVHLALAHGWRSDGAHAFPERWTHEGAHLYSPNGQIRLDVHRFVVAWSVGSQRRQRTLTRAMWAHAQAVDWEGIRVWCPSPTDALVIALALNRQWSGDQGGLKPADYADTRVLLRRSGLTMHQLAQRAQHVGAGHTWAAFWQVCNPERRHFALNAQATSGLLKRAARHDGVNLNREVWRIRLSAVPRRLRSMISVLPDVLAARWALRGGGDPRAHLARWTRSGSTRPLPPSRLQDVILGVSHLTRLLYPRQSRVGTCLPRAYATYRVLHRLGCPVVFVSGVGRTSAGIQGHAWIENARGSLDAYGEPLNRMHFKEVFHYPE